MGKRKHMKLYNIKSKSVANLHRHGICEWWEEEGTKMKNICEDIKCKMFQLKEKIPRKSSKVLNNRGESDYEIEPFVKVPGTIMRRSKSCEKILSKCRDHFHKVCGIKDLPPLPITHQTTTLRRSRRQNREFLNPLSLSYNCYARAVIDYIPSPYDEQALPIREGDLIGIITKDPSGLWLGECDGRIGRFKFINVEIIATHSTYPNSTPGSVAELVRGLELTHLTSKLELNGLDSLERLKMVTRHDLEFLEITEPEDQQKLLRAAASLSTLTNGEEQERNV